MQAHKKATESSATADLPELPCFEDRLPDLTQAIRHVGEGLLSAKDSESYLPYWEDLYAVVHALKGSLGFLKTPEPLARFMLKLSEALLEALSGSAIVRDKKKCGKILLEIEHLLEEPHPENNVDKALLPKLQELHATFQTDLPHEERLKKIPENVYYVNDCATKKAREIELLNLNHCVVEDHVLLEQISFWRSQLEEALRFPEFGRGMVVSFIPFIGSAENRSIHVWAWVAASSLTRASFKQRLKDTMPKVTISSL